MNWETVIGLEVHVQLQTKSKIFSGSATRYGAPANTEANVIDLGMPGVLPVLNQKVVEMAVKFGLAIQGTIAKRSIFARKNYFYPDLPKGYQISQYESPIVQNGHLDITLDDGQTKRIRITRAHLEEDAGKSLHEDFHGLSGIDLNRAGTPLIEVVSEPDMRSSSEAVLYLKALHSLVRYLEISDGNMQEGSFRCDANVSVRPMGSTTLGTRTELKNINSFRFVDRAIQLEAQRHIGILEKGGAITQETRLYDADKHETRPMRGKEDAKDYRYFPDPDLLPLVCDDDFIAQIRKTLPELPQEKRVRFQQAYQLNDSEANALSISHEVANYFEQVMKHTQAHPQTVAHWLMGDLAAALNKAGSTISESPVSAEQMAILLNRIHDQTISGKIAKQVFEQLCQGEHDVDHIIANQGLRQVTDTTAIETIINQIFAQYPQQAAEFKAGKEKLLGFFVGQVMKATQGKANPDIVNQLLKNKL